MSVKNIIKELKEELGNISLRGFGYGLRSRSHRVVQDSFFDPVSALKQSFWADLPPELLREILVRIEASDDAWPSRKNVVACAGVCKNWRRTVKEIVQNPQASGKITFPISLKQPGPRGSVIQCSIKRNRRDQTYYLYLSSNIASNDDGKFLLAARRCRRPTYTDHIISFACDDVSKRSSSYIGKLRSNFLANKFTVYDSQPPDSNASARMTKCRSTRLANVKQVPPSAPSGNYRVAHISYELNSLGSRGPRRMDCIMDAIPISAMEPEGQAPTQTEFLPSRQDAVQSLSMFRSKSSRMDGSQSGPLSFEVDKKLLLINKSPRWHEQLQCWCLNFNGRVTVASVKNFQLVASAENGDPGQEDENVILQFGKVGKDAFTMDYQYPLSAFQAFAICLSSFDTKIARE